MQANRQTKCCRYFGRVLRMSLFCLNAVAWTVGMLCILGTLLVGFYSKTIKISWVFDLYDFTLTTPATILFYYGVVLGITTISGCFAGSGGRWWSTGLYCILLICLAIFDYISGIQVFFKRSSLLVFLDTMADSMMKYMDDDATFGIYPRNTKEYWDHIQQQGHCCGMFDWWDWKHTPIGKNMALPDSCCNERYRHPGCGFQLVLHPGNADHQLADIIHTKGCLKVYPRRYIWAFLEASTLGIILAFILLFDFILSLILFIIVVTCFYRPGKPIKQPRVSYEERHRSSGEGRKGPPVDSPDEERRDPTPHRRRRFSSQSPDVVATHDQFGNDRQRVEIPSGTFEIEVEQHPQHDLEVII